MSSFNLSLLTDMVNGLTVVVCLAVLLGCICRINRLEQFALFGWGVLYVPTATASLAWLLDVGHAVTPPSWLMVAVWLGLLGLLVSSVTVDFKSKKKEVLI